MIKTCYLYLLGIEYSEKGNFLDLDNKQAPDSHEKNERDVVVGDVGHGGLGATLELCI